MSYQASWYPIEPLLEQLEAEGYRSVEAPDCVDRVLLKQSRLGPRVKATVDITTATEPLTLHKVIYEHFTRWAKSLLGNNGMGVLVFEYRAPPIQVVNEIARMGQGFAGGAQVVASVYDQATGEFWLWQPMQGTYSTKKFP
jgi:hypothetical protein